MEIRNMPKIDDIRNHYKTVLEKKIFLSKNTILGVTYYIMYIQKAEDEEINFVETFSQYFPYYVWNEDQLETLNTSIGMQASLEKASKKCWNSPIVAKRKTEVNGIYGELFLDFYERVVHERKLIITYASRREYCNNMESKGYDHIGYLLNNNVLELVIGEAKYVSDISSAKKSLLEDIRGKSETDLGHLSKSYFEDFMSFVVLENKQFSDAEKQELKTLMHELNELLVNGTMTFLEYILKNNIKLNVVLFAIFSNDNTNHEDLKKDYDELYINAKNKIELMDICNYDIEVVFIPTKATSMKIKGKIDEFYK